MSAKDKTRDKLLGSMRKTKAAGGNKSKANDASSQTGAETASAKPAASQTSKKPKAAGKKAGKRQQGTKPAAQRAKYAVDPYQSVRRVWPD